MSEKSVIYMLRNILNEHRQKAIARKAGGKILDVGSSAIQNRYLNPHQTTGIDLEIPKQELYKIVQSDLNREMPFKDTFFDTVIAGEILEHLENPSFTLREIYRVLKPGGRLVVTIPNGWLDMLMISLHKSQKHLNIFCPELFYRLLFNSGFKDVQLKRITKWYLFTARKKS